MQERKTALFTYSLIRAPRKTLSLRVNEDGSLTVRAPYRLPAEAADRFVEEHRQWIRKRLLEQENKRRLAARIFAEKCRRFAAVMGVSYGTITIREQKTRWGSCSAKGNLNFNWKTVLMPEEIQDYLTVHELAHRIEMNHSPAFWAVVERVLPDYRERRRWLLENGKYY